MTLWRLYPYVLHICLIHIHMYQTYIGTSPSATCETEYHTYDTINIIAELDN